MRAFPWLIYSCAWALSGGLAAVAGVLLAIIVNVYPLLGFFVLLFVFSAVIVGGIGSPYGAMLGGLIIGLVQKLSNVVFTALQQAKGLEGGPAYKPAGTSPLLHRGVPLT